MLVVMIMESEERIKLKKDIGYRFMVARKASNFTQQEIADRLGVSRTTITNWERGLRAPEVEDLVALSNILDQSPNYFLGTSNEDSTVLTVGDSADKLLSQSKATQTNVTSIINNIMAVCDDDIKIALIQASVNAICGIDTAAIIKAEEKVSVLDDQRLPEEVRSRIALKQEEIKEILRDAGYEAGVLAAESEIIQLQEESEESRAIDNLHDEYESFKEEGYKATMDEYRNSMRDDSE